MRKNIDDENQNVTYSNGNFAQLRNPFVHRLQLSWLDKIQIAVMSVTVFPIRAVLSIILIFITWVIVVLILHGRKSEDLLEPMTGWRRFVRPIAVVLARSVYFVCGFHWVTVRGTRASAKEAAILVVAPHTSFYDSLPVVFLGMTSVVTRASTEDELIFGDLTKFTQPVFVNRADPESRRNTVTEISRRALSRGKWPQIMVFAEGTCTNGTSLISYKHGAFLPGVPVQPVCVKYINKMNTTAWTWDGPGLATIIWLTMCQFNTRLVVEFLPVYRPSAEEQKDVNLFARNVRTEMARCLQVPVTDYSFDDCRLLTYRLQVDLPITSPLFQCQRICKKLRLRVTNRCGYDLLERLAKTSQQIVGGISLDEFACLLDQPKSDQFYQLFDLFHQDKCGKIDLRVFTLSLYLLAQQPVSGRDILKLAFRLFDHGAKSCVTEQELRDILELVFGIGTDQVKEVLTKLYKVNGPCNITYDEFESYAEPRPQFSKLFRSYQLSRTARMSKFLPVPDDDMKTKYD